MVIFHSSYPSISSIEVCYALLVEWFDGVSARQLKTYPRAFLLLCLVYWLVTAK